MRAVFCLFLLAVSVGASETARPTAAHQQFVVGISPYLERSVKDEVYRGLVRLLVEGLPVDSSLVIYDAYRLRTIAEADLPKLHVFESAKARANQFAPSIQKIKLFLAADDPRPTNTHMSFEGALRLPQFCEFLAENPSFVSTPLSVLLIGSPLYQDVREPAFSMSDGYFPSDAHLQASCEKSIFGMRRATHSIPAWVLHWVYFGDPWLNDLHKEKITRFWTLYLEQRDGRLLTLGSDLPTGLRAFAQGTNAPHAPSQGWAIDPTQTKLEMLRINRHLELTDWITREAVSDPSPHAPRVLVGPIKIGIRWKENIDLDLYATPRPGAQTLFFEHARSPEGYYYKDHRSSPGREYEFIEFESPVDVRKVEAFVNFYRGSCPDAARGEARIEFDGRTYSAPFSISATQGNLGRSGPDQEQHWTRIPVQEMLKLRPE